MTSVTEVQTVPLAQLPGAAPADNVQPGNSFADHLARARERQLPPVHRAYSFAELGIFGLHGALIAHDNGQDHVARPKVLIENRTRAPQDDADQHPELWGEIPGCTAVPTKPELRSDGQQFRAGPFDAAPSASLMLGSSGTLNSWRPTRELPAQPSAVKRKVPPMLAKPIPDPVSVIVSGGKKTLKIDIRSDEPIHQIPKLRRLVETTVAQFEMDMAELHLNGSMSQPAFSLGGGIYGGRSR